MPDQATSAPGAKIGYLVRWSTPGQTGNYRGKEQDEALPAILAGQGFVPVPFHEGQISGRDLSKRPDAERLLTAIRSGEVQGMAAWDVKRITRDETGMDAGRIIRACQEKLALIVTADRSYRLWDRRDLRDFKRDALDAGENLLDIRDTFWQGLIGRAKREAFFMSRPATGYTTRLVEVAGEAIGERTRVKREPLRDEGQADMMRALGEALDVCQTIHEVVCRMNATGLLPTSQRGEFRGQAMKWATDRVENVIYNPLYVGLWTFGRRMKANSAIRNLPNVSHGAIQPTAITNEGALFVHSRPDLAWYSADRQRAWQAKYVPVEGRPKLRTRSYVRPLRGVIACAGCGRVMIARGADGYACPTLGDRVKRSACPRPQSIGEPFALAELWKLLPRLLAERADALDVLRSVLADSGPLADKRAQLEELRTALDEAIADWSEGDLPRPVPPTLKAKWAGWQAEVDRREAELRQLERATVLDGERERVYHLLATEPERARDKMTVEQQAAMFREIVCDVQLSPWGKGRYRRFTVKGYRNLMLSTVVTGDTASSVPSYLGGLLD